MATQQNQIVYNNVSKFLNERTVTIVGAPFCYGQPKKGVENGPKSIRAANLVKSLKRKDLANGPWLVEDSGDILLPENSQSSSEEQPTENNNTTAIGTKKKWKENNADVVDKSCLLIAKQVYKVAMEKKFSLVLGGDHSIAIGSIGGLLRAYPELRIIWVDAHADINTPETSFTGNLHGMPVSYLMGMNKTQSKFFSWLYSAQSENFDGKDFQPLQKGRIAYIGLRDVDPGEKRILKENGIKAFSMQEVDEMGIAAVMKEAVKAIDPEGVSPIHLSFDIDGLDPSVAPSTGTAVHGGLSMREGRYICETLYDTSRLVSMDMVEVNPSLAQENADLTASTAVQMIATAFGRKLL